MTLRTDGGTDTIHTRKIVAGLFASLDCVVGEPEKWGFQYMTKAMSDQIVAGIAGSDAVLLGPRTYALFTRLWRHQRDDVPMAKFLNNSPKYVVSKTAGKLDWLPATPIGGDLSAALASLKAQPGMNIQVPGSPRLVLSLLRDGLLDELNLMICPVVVGTGLRLFDDLRGPIALSLVDWVRFDNGVLALKYKPRSAVQGKVQPQHFPQAASGG